MGSALVDCPLDGAHRGEASWANNDLYRWARVRVERSAGHSCDHPLDWSFRSLLVQIVICSFVRAEVWGWPLLKALTGWVDHPEGASRTVISEAWYGARWRGRCRADSKYLEVVTKQGDVNLGKKVLKAKRVLKIVMKQSIVSWAERAAKNLTKQGNVIWAKRRCKKM